MVDVSLVTAALAALAMLATPTALATHATMAALVTMELAAVPERLAVVRPALVPSAVLAEDRTRLRPLRETSGV